MSEKCQPASGCACGSSGGHHHGDDSHFEEALTRATLGRIRHKFLVMSGKGGVGKSSVAVTLALTLARRGFQVGLMDVDLHGPNVLRMLGLKQAIPPATDQLFLTLPELPNLKVVSIEAFMPDRESAIIWRGPLKHSAIRQFVTDVNWGPLDYLIIDAPPGTGDEPLSVVQTIPEAQAIIVTTPQEIALADVRKSIDFCRKTNLQIVGVIENMSKLVCPECGKELPLFASGGGARLANQMEVPLLGSLPFEPQVVAFADQGRLAELRPEESHYLQALAAIVPALPGTADQPRSQSAPATGTEKFAIPLEGGQLCSHFGHCEKFAFLTVAERQIIGTEILTPPPHEPGRLPLWLAELGVTHVIAGGLGTRAQELLRQQGIEVISGAPTLPPEELVQRYLAQTLVTGPNVCDH